MAPDTPVTEPVDLVVDAAHARDVQALAALAAHCRDQTRTGGTRRERCGVVVCVRSRTGSRMRRSSFLAGCGKGEHHLSLRLNNLREGLV